MKKILLSILLVTMVAMTSALAAETPTDQIKKNLTDYLKEKSPIKYKSAVVTVNDTNLGMVVSPVATESALNYSIQLATISLATKTKLPNINNYGMVITDKNGKNIASIQCSKNLLDKVKMDQSGKPDKQSISALILEVLTTTKIFT